MLGDCVVTPLLLLTDIASHAITLLLLCKVTTIYIYVHDAKLLTPLIVTFLYVNLKLNTLKTIKVHNLNRLY